MWTVHSQVPRQKSTKSRAWCSFMTWSTSRPVPGIHFLRLDKAYLKCDQSRAYVLAEPMKAASMPQRPFASFDVDRAQHSHYGSTRTDGRMLSLTGQRPRQRGPCGFKSPTQRALSGSKITGC
ncbi:unnamed protein product [Durusdinium trenchii]|uniref:Uncharacterized protein n=1 Tax=Durusdinium trenchii TaxID=1381693 RepID=A0ABP0IX33_9DINO